MRRLAAHPAAPWTAFLLSRLVLLFGYEEYLSDVRRYAEWAARAWGRGEHAYADFFFPYPPLALALVYLPRLGGAGYASYRSIFHLEMLLLDLACLFLVVRIAGSRLGLDRARRGRAVLLYSVLALPLGHLFYDRLDLAIAVCFLAVLLHAPSDLFAAGQKARSRSARPILAELPGALWSGAGILLKIVPLFWLPWLWVFSWLGRRRVRAGGFLASLMIGLGPAAIVLLAWNAWVDGALLGSLMAHVERGIQIESSWASPLWLASLTRDAGAPALEFAYDAHHFSGEVVPRAYRIASRLIGFALIAAFLLALWVLLKDRRPLSTTRDGGWGLYFQAGTAMVLLLLATQPLLSPQFFVWLLPALCLYLAAGARWWEHALVGLIYALTWVEFDVGYRALLRGDTVVISALAARNVLLVAFAAWSVWALLRRCRDGPVAGSQPSDTV